ncbi:MAG: nucleoside triphosphate pyrophosphohydrolase [bacterium]|nr:nucleoside triphosphate pyrophosphohydrolase [bacterium]
MKIYNKLVRDKIPEIIAADGVECKTKILETKEYREVLLAKVVEEALEIQESKGDIKELVEEVGDVLEVIDAIVKEFALDETAIQAVREERREKRGGFDKKILLESTNEE